ncbi:hypothetical protein BCV70DRAFT_45645 [Testicularia cyperi]|uniref:Uncharacterized protein n=1 Tax=Testicularia cyperi TaxID=1882483 RepID=A0A317XIW5_9BASI|nr:hypothetical protein BCV70DRAFT_45645 [Testicularia cyperi]
MLAKACWEAEGDSSSYPWSMALSHSLSSLGTLWHSSVFGSPRGLRGERGILAVVPDPCHTWQLLNPLSQPRLRHLRGTLIPEHVMGQLLWYDRWLRSSFSASIAKLALVSVTRSVSEPPTYGRGQSETRRAAGSQQCSQSTLAVITMHCVFIASVPPVVRLCCDRGSCDNGGNGIEVETS